MPEGQVLTDSEGAILTLVLRRHPVTAYEIGKSFAASPVHTLNTSKGTLYPLIHRLEERGFLEGTEVLGDKRGTHRFSCTLAGRQALKRWILAIRPEHELLHDPLRKKLQGFELLTRKQQVEWIIAAQERLRRKLGEVTQWPAEIEGPFGDLVKRSAAESLEARLSWLAAALKQIDPS